MVATLSLTLPIPDPAPSQVSSAAGGKGGVEAEAVGRLVKQLGGGLRQLVFVSCHGALALPLTLTLPLPWSSYPPTARCAISPYISRYLPISPYISIVRQGGDRGLPISPDISRYLPISP